MKYILPLITIIGGAVSVAYYVSKKNKEAEIQASLPTTNVNAPITPIVLNTSNNEAQFPLKKGDRLPIVREIQDLLNKGLQYIVDNTTNEQLKISAKSLMFSDRDTIFGEKTEKAATAINIFLGKRVNQTQIDKPEYEKLKTLI